MKSTINRLTSMANSVRPSGEFAELRNAMKNNLKKWMDLSYETKEDAFREALKALKEDYIDAYNSVSQMTGGAGLGELTEYSVSDAAMSNTVIDFLSSGDFKVGDYPSILETNAIRGLIDSFMRPINDALEG
jgi:hypothetical protein